MSSCTGTISRAHAESAFGGRNGLRASRLCNSSSILVSLIITREQAFRLVANVTLGFIYFASYTYFSSTYFPWAPNWGKCAGEEFAALSGIAIITSYLVLFISFYIATYNKTGKGTRPRRNTGKQAVIDMKDYEVPSISANANGSATNGNAKTNGSAVSSGRANGGPVTRSRKA